MIFVETRGSRHDWKEDDDEESESMEEETWREQTEYESIFLLIFV